MIRLGEKRQFGAGKRVVLPDSNADGSSPRKVIRLDDNATSNPNAIKRIMEVLSDRQASSSH